MTGVQTCALPILQKIYEYYGARHPEKELGSIPAACGEKRQLTGKKGSAVCDGIGLTVSVQTKEQFETVFSVMNYRAAKEAPLFQKEKNPAKRITMYLIVDADLFMEEAEIQGAAIALNPHFTVITFQCAINFLSHIFIVGLEKPQATAPSNASGHLTFMVYIRMKNPAIIMNNRLEGAGNPSPYTLSSHEKRLFDGYEGAIWNVGMPPKSEFVHKGFSPVASWYASTSCPFARPCCMSC